MHRVSARERAGPCAGPRVSARVTAHIDSRVQVGPCGLGSFAIFRCVREPFLMSVIIA